jgi:glycoprotein endo-alpha-1,2-mannosidase
MTGVGVGAGYNDERLRPWNRHNTRARGNNGEYYSEFWNDAIRALPDIVSITSFNEWGEGTQIEPARSGTILPIIPTTER